MPIILEFPIRKPEPEIALANILKKYSIQNFGKFGMWNAKINVGKNNKWLKSNLSVKIDTGASISFLPIFILKDLGLEKTIRYDFYGIVRTEECKVPVYLNKVDIKIIDFSKNFIELKDVWVAITELEEAPILLGYKDVLERLVINQTIDSEAIRVQKRIPQ